MKNKVIKNFDGQPFLLTDEQIKEFHGARFKETFWIECNEVGEIPNKPVCKTQTWQCRIPEDSDDINIASIDDNCFNTK